MSTINLLPPKEKDLLVQEERWKLTLILGFILLAFFISLVLILFSVKTYISGQVEAQKILLSQKELESPQIEELAEKIKESNLVFSNLNSFYQQNLDITEILEKISQALPSGSYIHGFDLSLLEGEYPAQVALTGFSPNRETLLEFKKNLEAEKLFQEIYFPPQNWVRPTDIIFSVNFKISK
ncbi:hypothetical protein AMJ50_00705 [Parcubacteria bacterium DG_74_3]|nr:MAG: hypothetical protein AMJ50_00705 [Parcubacteria bacterium DG_74_3]